MKNTSYQQYNMVMTAYLLLINVTIICLSKAIHVEAFAPTTVSFTTKSGSRRSNTLNEGPGRILQETYSYTSLARSSLWMSATENDGSDGSGSEMEGESNNDDAPSDVDMDADTDMGSEEETFTSNEPAEYDLVENGLGEWEEMHGNYILRPPVSYEEQPRALIHFLGGAIVGAAPDISYRYLLERLAQKGFLIVATPYTLSFDYVATCDDIIGRFERIAPSLARQFGPVPVVGVGHSCGALLQLLITTLFPDTPRAANALMSYNNKGVKEAIPFFEEIFAPLFVSLANNQTNPLVDLLWSGNTESNDASTKTYPPTSVDLINISIELSRNAVRGNLPSDELLSDIAKKTTPKSLAALLPQEIQIPSFIRDTLQQAIDPLVKAQSDAGISPLLDQSLDVLEQIPSLIEEVAEGARDFNPPPSSVRAAARRSYRARRTLVIEYDDDPLDESEEVETLLQEAETVMRNKRPMVDFDVQRTVLKGGHATPCLAPPLDLATKAEDILGDDSAKQTLLYRGADETVEELVRWLEEGNL